MSITVQELAEYYAGLLIVQYNNKEKAKATIELFTKTLLPENEETNNLLLLDVQDAFNIDTCVGNQLDIVDEYIGVDRAYMGSNLSDDDFRFLIKLKIIQNNSNHSFKSINDGLYDFFEDEVFMVSDGDMSLTYYVPDGITTVIEAAINKKIFPVPMGVNFRAAIVSRNYFGFTEYGSGVVPSRGFTDYSDIDKEGDFLIYDDIII